MGRSGVYAYVEYGKQSNFTTALGAGASTRQFGLGTELGDITVSQDAKGAVKYGDVFPSDFYFGRFAGSVSVDFIVSNPWWFDLIIGNASTTGIGPYTHTFNVAKSVNAITIEAGFTGETSNRVRLLERGVVRSASIRSRVGEEVKASLSIDYGKESNPTSIIDTTVAGDGLDMPYVFSHASVEMPSGTVLTEVQEFSLDLNPNITLVYEHGDRFAVNAFKGQFEVSGNIKLSTKDTNGFLDDALGLLEIATAKFKLTNGLTGVNEKSITINLTDIVVSEFAQSMPVYDLVADGISFMARGINVDAVNNITTPP